MRIPIPNDIKVVVLDMDGTIYSKPRMAWYMIRKQRRHLPSLIAERRWRRKQRAAVCGQPSAISRQRFTEKWYRENYLPSMVAVIREHYRPQSWLPTLIDECKQRGIKIVILSDYEAVKEKLQALGLHAEDFDAILAAGDVGTVKPDPRLGDAIRAAINNAALSWRQVLFVGDREDTDGQLARALGAQFLKV